MVDKETLDRCLEGISFPADGGTIADHASFNGCPSDVVAAIRKLAPGIPVEVAIDDLPDLEAALPGRDELALAAPEQSLLRCRFGAHAWQPERNPENVATYRRCSRCGKDNTDDFGGGPLTGSGPMG